jgi:hypothetical protein
MPSQTRSLESQLFSGRYHASIDDKGYTQGMRRERDGFPRDHMYIVFDIKMDFTRMLDLLLEVIQPQHRAR